MKESLYLEGNDQLVELLKKIPAFTHFDEESLKKLMRLSKLKTYQPEEKIIREGSKEKGMYLLISGSVSISKNHKTLLSLQRTGDIFGEMSLLEPAPRSATVKAVTETLCLIFDAEYLEGLNDYGKNSFHAAIYHMFAQILAHRLRVTTEKYIETKKENEDLRKEINALAKKL